MGSIVMEPDDIASYTSIYYPTENHSSICMSVGKIQSEGVFFNQNPFSYSVPLLLAQLSLASSFILLTSRLLKPLGQPSMVIQILGGLTLGPSLLGQLGGFTAVVFPIEGMIMLDVLSVFGYMFYFFLIGVQIDPWILRKIEKREIAIGITTVVLGLVMGMSCTFIILGVGISLEENITEGLPLVATISSVLGFPVIAHYLTELKIVNSELGRLSLSSSLVSNLFSFCIVTLTILSTQQAGENFKMLQTVGSGIGLAILIVFVVRPLILWFLNRNSEEEPLRQELTLIIFVGVLVTGFLSKALGLHIFYGPLVYGMAIPAGPPIGSALVEKLDLITSWLFMPLYFVKNGLVINVFSVQLKNYLVVQVVILASCVGKFLGCFLISTQYFKLPSRDAILISLVTNVQGVLELGMFKMMKQSKAIENDIFVILCTSMLIVTAIVTPIIRYLYDPFKQYVVYRRRTVLNMKHDSQVLEVLACIHDQENVPTTINLFEALHPTRHSRIDICLLHLVELVGRAHPILIPHKFSRNYSSKSSTSKSIINAFKLFQESYNEVVNLHAFTAISPYSTMHDEVCTMALDKKVILILIPFHKKFSANGRVESSSSAIKTMNANILEVAPCSVAIIVDRSLVNTSRPVLQSWSSYRVGILFLGGADDHEALAIGARMVGELNISLTIVRLVENEDVNVIDTDEKQQDNDVINEFRLRLAGNYHVIYVEEVVADGTGTVGVIRSMENHYELIIVGRRHNPRSAMVVGLSDWNEESELGTIGDMFAAEDFNSNATILAVQQHTNAIGNCH